VGAFRITEAAADRFVVPRVASNRLGREKEKAERLLSKLQKDALGSL